MNKFFFFASRRRHTRFDCDWSSDVCSSDLLHLWADLGEWWRAETGLPLPLGGNVVRRDLGPELMRDIARDLKASIEYGLAHRREALAHARGYSRGLDDSRTDRFVGMYVNAYT